MSENAKERYEELTAKGYKTLIGDDRKEYRELKKQFEPKEEKVGYDIPKTEENDSKSDTKVQKMEKTVPKMEKITVTREYFMLNNVKHNGIKFMKGDKFKGDEKTLNLFLEKKFIEIRINT